MQVTEVWLGKSSLRSFRKPAIAGWTHVTRFCSLLNSIAQHKIRRPKFDQTIKLWLNHSITVEKINQHIFYFRLAHPGLFGPKWGRDMRFGNVVFSIWVILKNHDSSPVIISSRQFGSSRTQFKSFWHIFTDLPFCSSINNFGTNFARIFLFPLPFNAQQT